MNTPFKTLVVIVAAVFPAAFIAQLLGVTLPPFVDTAHLFGAFVAALTVLTMLSDYAPAKPLRACAAAPAAPQSRSHLRLAA